MNLRILTAVGLLALVSCAPAQTKTEQQVQALVDQTTRIAEAIEAMNRPVNEPMAAPVQFNTLWDRQRAVETLASQKSTSANGYAPDSAEGAAAITARTNALQARIAAGAVDIGDGNWNIDPDILTLPHRGSILGRGALRSVFSVPAGSTGVMLTSDDFATHESAGDKWAHSGLPTNLRLDNLGFNGGETIWDNYETSKPGDPDDPSADYDLDAVKLFTAGLRMSNVHVAGVYGHGFYVGRGNIAKTGAARVDDNEVNTVEGCSAWGTLTGFRFVGSADLHCTSCVAAYGRDVGFAIEGGAYELDILHAAGFINGTGDQDTGLGFRFGLPGNPGTDAGRAYCGRIQGDHCRIGARIWSAGTSISHYITKLSTEKGLDVRASSVHIGLLESTTPDPDVIDIHVGAQLFSCEDDFASWTVGAGQTAADYAGSIHLNIQHNLASITKGEFTGVGAYGTWCSFGTAGSVHPIGCEIGGDGDYYVTSALIGLKVNSISTGNLLHFRHNAALLVPVLFESTSLASNVLLNSIKTYNVITGRETLWSTIVDPTGDTLIAAEVDGHTWTNYGQGAGVTFNLPAANVTTPSGKAAQVTVHMLVAQTITLDAAGSDTIDGGSAGGSITGAAAVGNRITLTSNGTNAWTSSGAVGSWAP